MRYSNLPAYCGVSQQHGALMPRHWLQEVRGIDEGERGMNTLERFLFQVRRADGAEALVVKQPLLPQK